MNDIGPMADDSTRPGTSAPAMPVVSTGVSTIIYPCDRGTGWPLGYHHFEAGSAGIVVCVYCGKGPR